MLQVVHMDCLAGLRMLPDNFADSIVTDPPYGLSFMGRKWDYDVPSEAIWRECLRVLKPGGHLLAFAGTRTQHRMAVRIEDAGFEIRDMIAWVYGSGFPKSMNVSKAVDGHVTNGRSDSVALRRVNETRPGEATVRQSSTNGHRGIVGSADAGPSVKRETPSTLEGETWQGWGTALKPAMEPITVARKPLEGTVAANVLAHGVGGLNIDGCRVGADGGGTHCGNRDDSGKCRGHQNAGRSTSGETFHGPETSGGRWPANLIHDGSDEVLGAFPQAPGQLAKASTSDTQRAGQNVYGDMVRGSEPFEPRNDAGSAARFFYCAKSSKSDRGEGNNHPTVKPTDLMRYLCRLVTPPGGLVLDPFTGSGSTGKAAALEGFKFLGFEREAEYVAIAKARIAKGAT